VTEITRLRESPACTKAEDRAKGAKGPSTLRLLLHDPSYTDRLAAFLRSVGQQPRVTRSGEIEVDAPDEELDAYLRVWQVMHPDAQVDVAG
jgi:hypothetical protein